MPQPYQIFTIYAREDAQYLKELRGQLRPLENAGRIKVWSDREINPGVEWEKEIVQHLDTADIILILVSADYYDSAYIHEVEIKYALARHEKGEAKVLPIIVRPVDFSDDPIISRLQVLPTDGRPVTDRHWQNRDDAWLDVVAGVKRTLGTIREAELQREQADLMARERQAREQREAEQRSREAQARHEREAAERGDNERLAQHKREQEQERRRIEVAAWQQAIDAHRRPDYEDYLARYPQGEYAREARFRIKELKRKNAAPPPWGRYVAMGTGLLALLLAVWWAPKLMGGEKEQPAHNPPVQTDTTRIVPTTGDNFKKDSAISSSPVEIEKPTKSTTVPTEKTPSSPAPSSPGVTFNYPVVRVAGGTFQIGSPAGEVGRSADECQYTVSLGSFSMGKYEVTQAQWKAIMGDNPSNFKNCDDCPVEQVSWNDAQSFIKKLKEKTGKSYRLPTEAEWEYAARGGAGASSMTKTYAGSNTLGSVAWFADNAGSKTHPVGGKSPNELGLYDMRGNVWEWCQDTWKPYPCDSKSTADSRFRVLRGGSWNSGASLCRTARRSSREPSDRRTYIGFRRVSVSLQ